MPLIAWVRKTHLYVGVFIAPVILFFAATGMLQILSLHQSSPGYTAPVLLQRLGALHKDQVFGAPHRPPEAKPSKPSAEGPPRPAPRPIGPVRWILKGFFECVGAGLIVNTLMGLYMAYKINRNAWLTGGLFAAGIVVPVILVAALPG
ncbi:MAG TPA: hypothetical protein VG960_02495 [Caulobacteraceae bacterium]|nr:hypothetical protein [Caulobacteraceae bacterium]